MAGTVRAALDRRLAELCLEFQRRSAEKHGPGKGYARVYYHGPSAQMSYPQAWRISYHHGDGDLFYLGTVIGHTRAAAIRWLLRQRRDWP